MFNGAEPVVPIVVKPVVSAPNTLSLSNLITGCKVFVERPSEARDRKAEILSMRDKAVSRAEKKRAAEQRALSEATGEVVQLEVPGDKVEYYVHYVEFNKVSRVRWQYDMIHIS